MTVRDHGVGLKPGEEKLVFNRFWRADPSRARQTGGTGLGLSISLEDARLHGGWLEAWGAPGQGAQFRLTVPRTQGVGYETSPLGLPPPGGDLEFPGAVEEPVEADEYRVTVDGSAHVDGDGEAEEDADRRPPTPIPPPAPAWEEVR